METLFFICVLHRQQNSTQFKNHEHKRRKIVESAGGYIRAMFENAGRGREMILKCEEKCGKYEDTYQICSIRTAALAARWIVQRGFSDGRS